MPNRKRCNYLSATDTAVTKQQVAAVKQVEITDQKVVIEAEKSDAEQSLSEALPALEAARLALADLEKNDITEIRSFATPPEAVQVMNRSLFALSFTVNCKNILYLNTILIRN